MGRGPEAPRHSRSRKNDTGIRRIRIRAASDGLVSAILNRASAARETAAVPDTQTARHWSYGTNAQLLHCKPGAINMSFLKSLTALLAYLGRGAVPVDGMYFLERARPAAASCGPNGVIAC